MEGLPVWLSIELALLPVVVVLLGAVITSHVKISNRLTRQDAELATLKDVDEKIDELSERMVAVETKVQNIERIVFKSNGG